LNINAILGFMISFPRFQVFTGLLLISLLITAIPSGMAQESVMSANENATGAGGSVSYTVGQVAFRTVESGSGILTEGVQQPYEILFMTGLEDEKSVSLSCHIYPNPASDVLTLKIDLQSEVLKYQLKTIKGEIIREMKVSSKETLIPVADLATGIYFLSILENNDNLTTWKVIKK
jgi:hypothetical protein